MGLIMKDGLNQCLDSLGTNDLRGTTLRGKYNFNTKVCFTKSNSWARI